MQFTRGTLMNKQKTLLILGAGVMQVPGILAAKSMGCRVCVVDGSSCAVGIPHADLFEVADLKFPQEIIRVAEGWNQQFGLDGVFTAGTDFSLTVAIVAEHFGLPCISPSVAVKASDKGCMRDSFKNALVSIPKYRVFDFSPEICPDFYITLSEIGVFTSEELTFPVVVKPVDNMGARGIRLCSNLEELQTAVEKACGYSRSRRVIIEEYIDGPEFSIDALVVDGEVTITGFAERHIYFPPYFIEMGHSMPTDPQKYPPQATTTLISEFKKGVTALGIDNGVAKGDVKLREEATEWVPYIGEIAARLSGGYMSGWTFPYATNIPLTTLAIKIALGEGATIKIPPVSYPKICLERAFISLPGRVKKLIIPNKEAKEYQGAIKELFLRVEEGDSVNFPVNNVEKCGNIITVGESRSDLINITKRFMQKILIQLDPAETKTADYLLKGKTEVIIPLQYKLKINKNKKDFFILFHILPKKLEESREGYFEINNCTYSSSCSDWEGRELDQLLQQLTQESLLFQLKNEEFLLASRSKENLKVKIPVSLFERVLSRGGRQGLYWLADRLILEQKKNRLDTFLKQWEEK